MVKRQTYIAGALGGAMVLAVLTLFFATHYRALFNFGAAQQGASTQPLENSSGLNIPTIDQMCQAVGATSANMADCQNDESQAAEFVIAWMGLNGFLNNGNIDVDQINLAAELGPNPTSPLTGGLDPNTDADQPPDPALLGADPASDPGLDPATGLPLDQTFDSPAQIAMFCMSQSMDWLQMHDCISRYDPSSRFTGQ